MEEGALEWYRVDRTPRRTLVVAVILVTLGATGIGAAFVSRLSDGVSHAIALGSASVMFAGVAMAVGVAWAVIQEDMYLAVRRDAVVLHWSREREEIVPWSEIDSIVARPDDRALTIATAAQASHEWEVRTGAAELAARLVGLRQKALHGLLG
jgi:hypothetical protein